MFIIIQNDLGGKGSGGEGPLCGPDSKGSWTCPWGMRVQKVQRVQRVQRVVVAAPPQFYSRRRRLISWRPKAPYLASGYGQPAKRKALLWAG